MVESVVLEFGGILKINLLDPEEAYQEFYNTCACEDFCKQMVDARPFKDKDELLSTGRTLFESLNKEHWLEAFMGHPKIGDVNSLKEKFKETKLIASDEQSGVNSASEIILNDLALYNEKYFNKFGYIFIVCATGKSAVEILSILRNRIENEEEEEIYIASIEQLEITLIRMEKLL
jgi:OHCU decarboxylase